MKHGLSTLLCTLITTTSIGLSAPSFGGRDYHHHDGYYQNKHHKDRHHKGRGHHKQNERIDTAKVIKVSPIYETIRYESPYEECHREKYRLRPQHANSTVVLGAIVGGAIGNELGHKKINKKVGAVTGAILGGTLAHDISHRHHKRHRRSERVCKTRHKVHHRKQITGYNVKYRYRGNIYRTTMDEHPGKRIKVSVHVRPLRR